MATPRTLTANRLNAAKSTGPRTERGKARSKLNAVAHGLRSDAPVIPGEELADWETFHAAVVADLGAVGVPEIEVAGRVALILWRQRRVARFEAATLIAPPESELDPDAVLRVGKLEAWQLRDRRSRLAMAERALADSRRLPGDLRRLSASADGDRMTGDDALFLLRAAADQLPRAAIADPFADPLLAEMRPAVDLPPDVDTDEFLAAVGVPAVYFEEAHRWPGWTAGAVRTGLARLAAFVGWAVDQLLAATGTVDLAVLEKQVEAERVSLAPLAAVERGRAALPAEAALVAILRCERHLAREHGTRWTCWSGCRRSDIGGETDERRVGGSQCRYSKTRPALPSNGRRLP